MEGFEISCLFTALVKLFENILKLDTLIYHHHGKMIDKVGNFVDGLAVIAVFCGNNCL